MSTVPLRYKEKLHDLCEQPTSERDLSRLSKVLPSASTGVQDWRELYLAALFEIDTQKLQSRIIAAERAVHVRTLQLLMTSEHRSAEGKALDKCLYALRALRACATK